MPVPHATAAVKFTLEWHTTGKKWRLTWSLIDEVGIPWVTHWRWVETDTAVDVLDAHRLVDAVKREMESWLPW